MVVVKNARNLLVKLLLEYQLINVKNMEVVIVVLIVLHGLIQEVGVMHMMVIVQHVLKGCFH